MTLLEIWRDKAYGNGTDDGQKKHLWERYFLKEKEIYEKILSDPKQKIECTVRELADKFGTDIETITGFLDGIDESLAGYQNDIDNMDEDTIVKIEIDPEKLYYNMVAARASWLYELPQWDDIISEDRRKELYHQQKISGTIVKGKKIGRNDPCPCGSGKKYKHCCGKNI